MTYHLKYKNYQATIHYSTEDKVLHGKLSGVTNLVLFEGKSISGLKKAFREAVNDYVKICAEMAMS